MGLIIRIRQHRVGNTQLAGAAGINGLPQHQQLCRALMPHQHRQQITGTSLRTQTKRSERHLQLRRFTQIDQIAMQQHGGADTDRRTVHRCNQWLAECSQLAKENHHRRFITDRWAFQKIHHVIAGSEAILSSGNQHRPY